MRKTIKDYRAMLLLAAVCFGSVALADEDMVLSRDSSGKTQAAVAVPAAPGQVPANQGMSALRVIGVWLLVLGIGGAATIYAARRRRAALLLGKKESRLSVIERVSLGAHRELLLVKACDRLLVVAAQPDGMTLLSDLPNDTSPSLPFSNLLEQQGAPATSALTANVSNLPPVPSAASMPPGLTRSALRASAFNLSAYAENSAPLPPAPQRNAFAAAPSTAAAPAWPEMESVS